LRTGYDDSPATFAGDLLFVTTEQESCTWKSKLENLELAMGYNDSPATLTKPLKLKHEFVNVHVHFLCAQFCLS
jgi:hypothetical protein